MILPNIRQTLILINQNSRFLRNTKRKFIKSPCSFQKSPLFTVYDLKRKKSNTLNKRQRTRLFDILRIAENYIFYNPTAHRRASPKPCTHTLFNNKVRYITYLIIILFFIIATIQNMIAFPRAGDGIAYAWCVTLINSISLQTLSHRQSDCTTAASPEPCVIILFQNRFA